MTAEATQIEHVHQKAKEMHQGGGSGAVYGLGLIGRVGLLFQARHHFPAGGGGVLQRPLLAGVFGL